MHLSRFHRISFVILTLALLVGLMACNSPTPTTATVTPTAISAEPTLAPTQPAPTATQVPLAAEVNGQGISLALFEAELARYQAALSPGSQTETPEAQRDIVLQDLIDQVLLAQAAAEAGFVPGEAELQARLDQLSAQLGGADRLASWQAEHGYTPEGFRESLLLAVAAAYQRDQIMASVPTTAEQVHARQILTYTQEDAERALQRIQPGLDFATLTYRYDPVSGGDLGWFPRGYLLVPQVEEAAFLLQPGEVSEIIESEIGYHLVQVIERDPRRPLSPDTLLVLQRKAVQDWLEIKREQSQITLLVP